MEHALACVVIMSCFVHVTGKVFHTQMNGRVVETQYGDLRGVLVSLPSRDLPQVEAYLGLQYASVLHGDLRFMPPTSPLEKWDGIRVKLKHSPVCPQVLPNMTKLTDTIPTGRLDHIKKLLPFLQEQSEECLYLNVYVPVRAKNETEPLPVAVFIHGETYEMGSGNAYDGSVMAAFGRVIVVTINYRLGILGFLSTGDSNAPGNYALLDQVAALHWVRENIAAFGGNPENVVLLGQGFGAALVHLLLVSPVTKGKNLFKRVIIQSGSALGSWAINKDPLRYTKQLAEQCNCSQYWGNNAQLVQCFKEKPYEELLTADTHVPKYFSTWAPVIDHRSVLPEGVLQLMAQPDGAFMSTDILLGVMKNEGFLNFPQHEVDFGVDELRMRQITRTLVRNLYQWHRQAIYDVIMHQYTNWDMPHDMGSIRDSLMELIGDSQITAPVVELLRLHAQQRARTYFYSFTYPSRLDTYPRWAGGVHGDDMTYVFGAPLTDGIEPFLSSFTRSEKSLSQIILTYWTNFMHSGNPNAAFPQDDATDIDDENQPTGLHWPEYDNQHQNYIQIGLKPVSRHHFKASKMALWLDLIPKLHRDDGLDPKYHVLDDYDNATLFEEEGTRQLDQSSLRFHEPLLPRTFYPPVISTMTTSLNTTRSSIATTISTTMSSQPSTPTTETTTTFRTTKLTTPFRTKSNSPTMPDYVKKLLSIVPGSNRNAGNVLSVSWPSVKGNEQGPTQQPSSDDDNKLSLSVTVAVGCSLLFLNILIFAGMYYQKDRMRQEMDIRKREIDKQSEARVMESDVIKSSTGHETDTNSSSMATPELSMSRQNHHYSQQTGASTLPRHPIPVVPPQLPHSNTLPYKQNPSSGRTLQHTCDHHAHLDYYHDSSSHLEGSIHLNSRGRDYVTNTLKRKSSTDSPLQSNHLHSNPSTVV